MKNILLFLFLVCSLALSAQPIRTELSIQARGSDINGLLGVELQLGNFGISESWRPMTNGINSFITTISLYASEFNFDPQPYVTIGYATKGYAYISTPDSIPLDNPYVGYDLNNATFIPCMFLLVGVKSTIYNVLDNRLSGKAGAGITISDNGQQFSFELSMNYILFKNRKYERMRRDKYYYNQCTTYRDSDGYYHNYKK
jgi:hypothetical protein